MNAPDPCADQPCQNGGRCVATLDGGLVCLCEAGYQGDRCEAAFDNCQPDPCKNGSICVDQVNGAYCDCADGWDGATCEHNHDDCADDPCLNGGACTDGFQTRTCVCAPGFSGESCEAGALRTCQEILDMNPEAPSGVFTVDPDSPGQGNSPLDVYCDNDPNHGGGGWMLVGEEHAGVGGTLSFLGISAGDGNAMAHGEGNALIGEHFRGLYSELWVSWSKEGDDGDAIHFAVNEEMFANNVRLAMPISDFWTTNSALGDWVNAAGGAVLCRASQDPDVRPGDSSWAIKPKDDMNTRCGCNSDGWSGRGAFYGGFTNPTQCNPSGPGWAAVADQGQPKGTIKDWWLQIWVR